MAYGVTLGVSPRSLRNKTVLYRIADWIRPQKLQTRILRRWPVATLNLFSPVWAWHEMHDLQFDYDKNP